MKNLILSTCFIAIVAIGCNKKSEVKTTNQTEEVSMKRNNTGFKIVNGIMTFNSIEDFEAKVEELYLLTNDGLEQMNQSNTNFTSLYKQYEILDAQADKDFGISADSAIHAGLIADIPDNIFASIVNKDGHLIIGDSIYYYSSGGYQVTDKINYDKHPNFNWSTLAKKGFGQGNNGNPEWAAFPPISKFFHTYNGTNSWPKHNGRNVRAIHTKWCSWFGVYGSAGAKIKLEKDSRVGGWINIEHANASNGTSSDFRYFSMITGGGNTWWDWEYYNKSNTKYTSNKNVNEIVLTHKVSLIAGPLQHLVGNFLNTVSITRQGCTLTSTWNN